MARKMKKSDPAYWMLADDFVTKPVVYRPGCYICEDPEFAQMGLPLCYLCTKCQGHVAADDTRCDDCGFDTYDEYMLESIKAERQRRRVSSRGDVIMGVTANRRMEEIYRRLRGK